MPVLQETLLLNTSPQAVFDFVCNFENTEKWDPGVKSARKRGTDPTQVGTTYDLVTVLKGNESEMVYAVTDWDPPRRMRIAGESEHVTSVDVIEIEPTDDGKTKMIYTAEIHLKSWRVIFTPFIGGMLHQLAKEAMTGLLQHIDGTNITPS